MNCKFCQSVIQFEPAKETLPNSLECPSCGWFYEWHPLEGRPTRDEVEELLENSSDQEWVKLHNLEVFVSGYARTNYQACLDEIPF